jgi:uncharacterized protein (PEP-CTERM system associated)
LFSYTTQTSAGDLEVNPSLSTSLISAQNKSVEFEESDSSIISVKPSIITSYKSKYLVGSMSAEHNQIQSETSINGSQRDSFTNYRYSGDISLIEQTMSLQLSGGQSYRSILSSQYFVNDPYLGADSLSKTQSNSANLLFTLPTPKYFGLNVNAGVSKVKTDRSINISSIDDNAFGAGNGIDNDSKSLQTRFYQGNEFSRIGWNISSSYQNTSRTNEDDLTFRSTRGDVRLGLISNLQLVLTGQNEDNDLGDNASFSRPGGNFESTGVGLSWTSSAKRSIQFTYNQYERNNSEKGNFGAFDLDWRFTNRTSIQASIGRRIYGKSGAFSFTHNTRRLRTQISYNEQVTTFSRLVTDTEEQGVFVCPENSFSIGNCVIPSSLTSELEPGEQSSNLLDQIPEISEEAILRKTLNASFGFRGRKVTSALSLRHNKTDYLQSITKRNSDVMSFTNSYKASRKTSLNLSFNIALIDEESTGTETETRTTSVGISRKLGRNMSTNLNFRYLDRSSTYENVNTINFSNSDLTDRRLTVTFVYDF